MTKTKEKDEPKTLPVDKKPESPKKEEKEIKVIERIIENREIAPQDAFGKLTRAQIQLIKNTIAKEASDDELKLFIQVCKGAQLNPFLRQVHLVPRWDSKLGQTVRAIQVSIDGFRSIAESSGAYAGNDDPVFKGELEVEYGDKEKKKIIAPEKATVTVYKVVQGQRYAFTATARWNEYYPGPKLGFQWHIRPYLMLGKCAEALALRKSFPKLLSGMYEESELDKGKIESEASEKQVKAFEALKKVIATADPTELENYTKKMEKSDKYTPEQKAEFKALVKAREAKFSQESDRKAREESK